MSTGTKVQGKVLNVTVFLMDIELTVIIASYGVTSIDMKLQQLIIWEYLEALATFFSVDFQYMLSLFLFIFNCFRIWDVDKCDL